MSIKASMILSPQYEATALGAELQRIVDREIDSYANRYKTALTRSMEEVMKNAIEVWHAVGGLSTGGIVASAVKAESGFIRSARHQKVIRVTASFNGGIIDSMSGYFPDAADWCSRHAEMCTMTIGQYIFFLRWDIGATALPERAHFTGSGWVNPNFMMNSLGPMKYYCSQQILELLPLMASSPGMMRSRNQKMGAGMKSRNRTGVGNLTHGKGGGT